MIDKYNEAGMPALERTEQDRAKPAEKCIYPRCEDCDKYHGHYCTVPIVITKQILWKTRGRLFDLEKRLADLERLVTDEILGSNKPYIATEEEYRNFTPIQRHWYDKAIDDAMKEAEFVEAMKSVKPSASEGATVKIVKSTPKMNYTWDDYFKESK